LKSLATTIAQQWGVETQVLAADLHIEAQRQRVVERLRDSQQPVDVLINNAGYGIAGNLAESDEREESNHLAIHVTAPLELTKAALPGMLERGHGRVVMVSSVAGYLSRGTYSAHKAWGLSLARSLNETYRREGVHVSAVAPGFTRTEFHQRMGMNISGVPRLMWLSASDVVASSLRAVNAGKAVVIPSVRYRVLVVIAQILPRRLHQGGL
jgi:short-subunit dehydrogenase